MNQTKLINIAKLIELNQFHVQYELVTIKEIPSFTYIHTYIARK
jgi:hypothetical protein